MSGSEDIVGRLRELAEAEGAQTPSVDGWPTERDWVHPTVMPTARARFIAACDPKTVIGLLDLIDRLTTEGRSLNASWLSEEAGRIQAEEELSRLSEQVEKQGKVLRFGITAMEKYLALYEGRIPGATIVGVHGLSTRDGQFFIDQALAALGEAIPSTEEPPARSAGKPKWGYHERICVPRLLRGEPCKDWNGPCQALCCAPTSSEAPR